MLPNSFPFQYAASPLLAYERTESILTSIADNHIFWDHQWRYIYANEAAGRATGKPREQILGRSLWELHPQGIGTEVERQCRYAMEKRVLIVFEYHYLATDTWWENRFYPVPEGLSVFATDITVRKRGEEELRESREHLRALAARLGEVEEDGRRRLARNCMTESVRT